MHGLRPGDVITTPTGDKWRVKRLTDRRTPHGTRTMVLAEHVKTGVVAPIDRTQVAVLEPYPQRDDTPTSS